MENDRIVRLLATIGKRIKQRRIEIGIEAEDVSEMTGLTAHTIRNIENGSETYFSNFLIVCFALNMHPKDMLDFEFNTEPLFELSEPRKEKTRLTARIDHFIESNFFQIERTSRDVVDELAAAFEINTTTSAVSVILNRKVNEKVLKACKKESFNVYKRV